MVSDFKATEKISFCYPDPTTNGYVNVNFADYELTQPFQTDIDLIIRKIDYAMDTAPISRAHTDVQRSLVCSSFGLELNEKSGFLKNLLKFKLNHQLELAAF